MLTPTISTSFVGGHWAGKTIRLLCVTARPDGAGGGGIRCHCVYLHYLSALRVQAGGIVVDESNGTFGPEQSPFLRGYRWTHAGQRVGVRLREPLFRTTVFTVLFTPVGFSDSRDIVSTKTRPHDAGCSIE